MTRLRLRYLDGRLLHVSTNVHGFRVANVVESVKMANALMFLCPLCASANLAKHGDHRLGTHSVRVYFADRGVDPGYEPKDRWNASGAGLDDLTLSPSVWLNRDAPPDKPGEPPVCRWHGFVANGEAG